MTTLMEPRLEQFDRDGYVVMRGLLDPAEVLEPLVAEYEVLLDNLAVQLQAAGQISSLHRNLPFSERLTRIYQESGRVHTQYFDMSLPQKNIRRGTPMWHGPAVFNLLTHPKLLDVVETFIGPEIYANPVQHVRIKPPERLTPVDPKTGKVQLGATPWHQDSGVVNEDADDSEILTVWMPVWDADIAAGCLQVVPGSHDEGLYTHCPGVDTTSPSGLQIPQHMFRVKDALPLPMKRGDVLFMHRRTCHSSLPNNSDRIRWSLDLRYNPVGQPTGRDVFPGFIARSRSHPETELRDAGAWAQMWRDARDRLAEKDPRFNRWSADDPACA